MLTTPRTEVVRVSGARVWLRAIAAALCVGCGQPSPPALVGADAARDDLFGLAIAISGDGSRVLVGASQHGIGGVAYVFVDSAAGWTQETQLIAADIAPFDGFGDAVALDADGSRALVGSPGHHAAYVYSRSGRMWHLEAQIPASGAPEGFGDAVALAADASRALIGAHGPLPVNGTGTPAPGAAVIYARNGTAWTAEATLVPDAGFAGDWFGGAVAFDADASRAIVGAPGLAAPSDAFGVFPASEVGRAYVFSRVGTVWTQEAALTIAPSASAVPSSGLDHWGYSVGLDASGARALVTSFDPDSGDGAPLRARWSSLQRAQVKLASCYGTSKTSRIGGAPGSSPRQLGRQLAMGGGIHE
jgi:hypothetical protein